MRGEKDLDKLLKTMRPKHNDGEYVFCTTKDISKLDIADIVMLFKEEEGFTIVLHKHVADKNQLDYTFIGSWITLTVYSSLHAIGLTAVFSKALADENVSCNVVAGYFHDHIFVDQKDAAKAMEVLQQLSKE